MSTTTKIEWTEKTWNPLVGCTRVSEGCRFCYAERMAVRNANMGIDAYKGLTNGDLRKPRWTGKVRFLPKRLDAPRRWRKPTRVFVNSMSDLLHEAVTLDQIRAILKVMRETPQHTYQVLTKRPERLAEMDEAGITWPANVWLGVSVENQSAADRTLPLLTARQYGTVQWVSYEPAIGPVDWSGWANKLDWIVIGGESGPGARPFDLEWARDVVETFKTVGVPVFVKQLGTQSPIGGNSKADKPREWPEDIRVREYPGESPSIGPGGGPSRELVERPDTYLTADGWRVATRYMPVSDPNLPRPERLEQEARNALAFYGLTGWRFNINSRPKSRLGCCRPATRTIEVSEYHARSHVWSDVVDTLLHEIAHALTPGDNHGPRWRAVAKAIGATPRAKAVGLQFDLDEVVGSFDVSEAIGSFVQKAPQWLQEESSVLDEASQATSAPWDKPAPEEAVDLMDFLVGDG